MTAPSKLAPSEGVREALEPFADIAGEGSDDFPDDTKVTITFGRTTHYAVKLGDFRRASAALAAIAAQGLVLVPVEPTEAMIIAGSNASEYGAPSTTWRAMLAAVKPAEET